MKAEDYFKEFWAGVDLEFCPEESEPKVEAVAAAAWNDGRQILLVQIILRLRKMRKMFLEVLEKQQPGTTERMVAADAVNAFGKLIVELAEMP